MKKKDGFTLIELLAVIVILAIIAVIATPIIVGIIEDSRKAAFERSVEGIIHATDIDFGTQEVLENYEYTLTNGVISNMNIPVNNIEKFNGTIVYDENGNSEYAIHNGAWCMKKAGGVITTEDYSGTCKLGVEAPCFAYKEIEGGIEITEYYSYEENNSANAICPNDIIIPDTISGKPVVSIGSRVFEYKGINSVKFPNTITNIGTNAFYAAVIGTTGILDLSSLINLTTIGDGAFETYDAMVRCYEEVILPNNVTTIGNGAFRGNCIKNVNLPENLETIGASAFLYNDLTSITIPKNVKSIGNYAFGSGRNDYLAGPNALSSVKIINKTSLDEFELFGSYVFGWDADHTDADIDFISE